ncbi:MAG: hypothetical protein MUO52_03085, partial [Desulfobacterales bacterium]|nr:hypothetical protein [Desulfobacterales bacterium]
MNLIRGKNGISHPLRFLVLPLVVILAGCATVGPDYLPHDQAVPENWQTPLRGGITAGEMDPQALAEWWTTLEDPALTSLIERAVKGNLNLKKARSAVREARARRGLSEADLFPTLQTTGAATR